MKNKKVFQKVVFIGLILLILFSLVAPAIFGQNLTPPVQEKLLNGLKVLMWPDAKADKVSIRIRVHSGSAFDPQGKEGVMQLLADNIFPSEASKDFFTEDLGGSLDVVSNYDYIEINASSRPDGFITMIETISAAVANPSIEKEQTAKLRAALLTKVAAWEADPNYVGDRAAASSLFGTFPYGRPEDGSSVSLSKIDFADLVDAKQRFLTADNATIAIWGKFERDLGFRAVRRLFGSWLKSDRKTPSTFRQPDEPSTALVSVVSPKTGASAVRLAMGGTSRNDKDFAASMVFTNLLETRLKTRIPAIYADQLFVRNEAHTLPGLITIGFAAGKSDLGNSNGKVEASDLIGKALADPITEAEFQAAKSAFQAMWAKMDGPSFWIDADTYKVANVQSYARIADTVTLADVTNFAEKARKKPLVTVLVSNPTTK